MRRWRARYWVLAAAGALIATVVVGAVDALAHVPVVSQRSLDGCLGQAPLTPVERPGLPWVEHRHWLQLSGTVLNRATYYTRDDATGALFRWPYVGTIDGNARFAVQTRWTWFNPDWKSHTWTLFYQCASQ